MALINVAYRVLSDPRKRAEHDRWIARQEARAESWQTPAGNTPPPPPPPPPRPARPSRPRKPPLDRSDMPESLRQLARGAVFYLLTLLIFTPFLMTVAAWWKSPEPRPVTARSIQTQQARPVIATIQPGTDIRDVSGVYWLARSEFRHADGDRTEFHKGKLVLRKLPDNRYVLIMAKSVRGTGILADAYVCDAYPAHKEGSDIILTRDPHVWATINGEQLTLHGLEAKVHEVTHWRRHLIGFTDKDLDQGIEAAERMFRAKV